VQLRTGKPLLMPYFRSMIRSAPPAPFRTALIAFAIAIAVGVLVAIAPQPY
jgi:hypothetical protein